MGGLGITNPSESAESEYLASIRMSTPLVDKIIAQSHETPDDADVRIKADACCSKRKR